MKILVFEDEIHNYHLIRNMLEEYDPQCDVIGPFTTIEQGREYLVQHKDVDIIITDIMLSDGLSFNALDYAPQDVPIIFITAYEEYALRAFKYYSLSYLLKPIGEEELSEAIGKAIRLRRLATMGARKTTRPRKQVTSKDVRFVVKTFNGERIIHVSTIRYIVSEQKNTYLLLLDGNSYRIDKTLDELAAQLDPALFMRVNRKYIVPLEQVLGTEHIENGKMLLLLKGDNIPNIIVSRTRKVQVCKWLNEG